MRTRETDKLTSVKQVNREKDKFVKREIERNQEKQKVFPKSLINQGKKTILAAQVIVEQASLKTK